MGSNVSQTKTVWILRHIGKMYDVILFENLRFVRPHEYDKSPFSKISTLESVFENLRFQWSKAPYTCGRKAKTEKKISVFENIRIRVDGA